MTIFSCLSPPDFKRVSVANDISCPPLLDSKVKPCISRSKSYYAHLHSGCSMLTHSKFDSRFRKAGYATIDRICDYYYSLSSLPVRPSVSPGYLSKHVPPDLPQTGQPFNEILDGYTKLILPGLTLWQHPSFFGFYPAACTFEGMIADLLISSACNPGFNVSVRQRRLNRP